MMTVRTFAWLVVLLAFAWPAGVVGAMGGSMGGVAGDPVAAMDCAGHPPPADPCPDKGTAKHAAGECCPAMAGSVAVLPSALAEIARLSPSRLFPAASRDLDGVSRAKDPPPPRV